MGKAEINGDPSLLLFFEPIGVLACQGLDETRFAVVDMAGRSNNVGHNLPCY
jgi:hypothetical protein